MVATAWREAAPTIEGTETGAPVAATHGGSGDPIWHAPDIATLWRVRSAVAVATRQALTHNDRKGDVMSQDGLA